MRKLLLGAVASTAMFLGTMQASAADIDVVPEPMGWNWYVSVFGGWSMGNDEDFDIDTTGGSPSIEVDLEYEDGFTAGIAVGAHFNEWLRAELELSGNWHDVEGDATPLTGTGTSIDGDATALFVLANLWLDIPIGDVFRPYVGGGVGFGRLDVDVDVGTGTTAGFDDNDWGFAYQLGVGVAFDFAENIAFDVGYRYKAINNAEFEPDATTLDDFEVDYSSHNIIAGVRIGF
jgi:opacity protein-like surface antigen